MDLFDAMYTQRAIRWYKPDPVSDEDIRKILTAAILELADRISTLLHHLVENAQYSRVVEIGSPINLDLIDGRTNQAYHFQPLFVAGFHGGLHVF